MQDMPETPVKVKTTDWAMPKKGTLKIENGVATLRWKSHQTSRRVFLGRRFRDVYRTMTWEVAEES